MAGRDRKNSLKELFSTGAQPPAGAGQPAPPQPGHSPAQPPASATQTKAFSRAPETKSMVEGGTEHEADGGQDAGSGPTTTAGQPRATSGAVRAMGLSLSSIAREAEEARLLREALAQGERIVAIDPERIEASFIRDRLTLGERDDPEFQALIDSIRETGQQSPILVRPLGGDQERYQVAYGHRRLMAARQLGRPVQAIVRPLTDDELVLAQGKENAERRNLSFIERALFARVLADRGFDRKLISDALGGLLKSELSRLIQVAEAIPEWVVEAIGPAPKVGRDRWMTLATMFAEDKGSGVVKAQDEVAREPFRLAATDDRFQRIVNRLKTPQASAASQAETITQADGRVLGRIERQGRAVKITFEQDVDPDFIDRLGAAIATAHAARKGRRKK